MPLPQSSLVSENVPNKMQEPGEQQEGALDDYDQMIFNQFMADENEDEMLARQMQE